MGPAELIRDLLPAAFMGLFQSTPRQPIAAAPSPHDPIPGISERALEELRIRRETAINARARLFQAAPPPAAVRDGRSEELKLATDDALQAFAGGGFSIGGPEYGYGTGLFWLGYPYLAELAQRPEYRLIVELFAKEMTRKWIKLKSTGKTDKSAKIEEITRDMRKFRVREQFREAKRDDGYFGRGQLFIKIKYAQDRPEVLRSPLIIDKRTIPVGSFRGFQKIEPYWVYPLVYNASDPLAENFYQPQTWSVFSGVVHDSRMLTFIANPVPDILKPSYSFGGISTTQLMKPYVDAFLAGKNGIGGLITAFSTMVLATNMSAFLNNGGSESLQRRAEAYNLLRDNFGLLITDKDTEEFKNVSAPLAGLDELQAQLQEHMLIPVRTPLMKAFGLSPAGLGQSQDNEIRSFYDNISSDQEDDFREPLEKALKIIQLNRYGDIDEDIDFDFVPLWQLDEAGAAAVQKTKSDVDLQNIEAGIISPEEGRQRLITDPESPYHGLDLEEGAPGTTEMDGEGNLRQINDPDSNRIDKGGENSETSGANSWV